MYQIVLLIHVAVAVRIIGLILIQQGKGAGMGAAFGSGASNTVFGSQGSGSFLMKVTAILATAFFVTSLTLGYIAAQNHRAAQQATLPTLDSEGAAQLALPLPPQSLNKAAEEDAP